MNKFNLPTKKGYCVKWVDENGESHLVPNSLRKTRKSAEMVALNYTYENQVQTIVLDCLF